MAKKTNLEVLIESSWKVNMAGFYLTQLLIFRTKNKKT
jgi:hypothetical protein